MKNHLNITSATHNLIDITLVNSRIKLDIIYATPHNFMGFAAYSMPLCFLHLEAAKAVDALQCDLENMGLCLKIFDGYRPLNVQQRMWDMVCDERYVSNPAVNKGRHTRGTAVDVTILDAKGRELEMPTPFDEFSERAHSDSCQVSPTACRNREFLKSTMVRHGFIPISTEWWHFDLVGWYDDFKYPALDISFEELAAQASLV